MLAGAERREVRLADTGHPRGLTHELCVVTSKDPDHHGSQDYCITWPGPVKHAQAPAETGELAAGNH